MTLLEIQERLIANCGERFAVSVLWRFFDLHEITFKKSVGRCDEMNSSEQRASTWTGSGSRNGFLGSRA
jgi:hypothetical protein